MEFRFEDQSIRINMGQKAALLAETTRRFRACEGFALATLNLDHLVKMRSSVAFRNAYAAQDLIVADGNPIVWLSRLSGKPVELVPGSDLVIPLVRAAAAEDRSVALLGSTPAALDGAAEALMRKVPGLKIACRIAPPMGFDTAGDAADDILRDIARSGAALCLIALGAPKQEFLAARGREIAPDVGFASIGAGLDFLSGHQQRAPKLVRALALEWLWRALSSPARMMPRYLQCLAILPSFGLRAISQRSSR